jgi:hypothetical protein
MKRLMNKMRPIVQIILVFALILLLQISCKEEFLEPQPQSFYAPENVYVNKAGFESGLVTLRRDLKNDFYGNRSPLQLDYVASDYGFGIALNDWNIITPSSGTYFPILPMFANMYTYIKNANVIISRIDGIKWNSESDRNAILGQALFYRSWWYYRLIMTYGDVPFTGIELTGPKLDFYTHSRWTILEKLITDVEFAAEWLPENTETGVPNKYAALHFLSKLYLANTEFTKAISTATTVINGPYDLMRNRFGIDAGDNEKNLLWDLHRPLNKSSQVNTEAIFVIIDREEAPTGAKSAGSYMARGFHCPWWYNWVLDSQGKPGNLSRTGWYYPILGIANPDVNQCKWFSYEIWEDDEYNWKNTPDLRRSDANWWDTHELTYENPASVDLGKPINFFNFKYPGDSIRLWPMPYYKTYYPYSPDFEGSVYGSNGDMYVFRLAETYLIRAEANFWNNRSDLAAEDINLIRERANAPLITSADIDIDFIFDERLRELSHEEMRHTEMVRTANIMAKLNIGGYSLDNISQNNWWHYRVMNYNSWYKMGQYQGTWTYIFKMEPKHIYWPIDVTYITTNTMGVINQNVGYDGDERNKPPLTEITSDVSYEY